MFPDINVKFQTLEMCNQAVSELPWCLQFVHNKYKTRDMCNNAVFEDHSQIKHVPDWFVTAEMLEKCKDE